MALSPGLKAVAQEGAGVEIFFSYAHTDEDLFQELRKHFSGLESAGIVRSSFDRRIEPGSVWSEDIRRAMERAQIILILLSADLLSSRYCTEVEIPFALSRLKSGHAKVIPIVLRPVLWKDHPLAKLQALPSGARAVIDWPNRDQAFVDVADQIRALSLTMREGEASGPGDSGDTLWAADSSDNQNLFGALHKSRALSCQLPFQNCSDPVKQTAVAVRRPQRFVARSEQLNELKRIVLAARSTVIGIVCVRGQAGIGKTVLVGELSRDKAILQAFPDGVIWIKVGRKPPPTVDLLSEVRCFVEGGPIDPIDHATDRADSASIAKLLCQRSILVVLDDVWDLEPIQAILDAFDQADCKGLHSALLFTTRKKSPARNTNAHEYHLQTLDDGQAELVLAEWLSNRRSVGRAEARIVFRKCQGHVLALRQIGSLLAQKIDDFGEDAGWRFVANQLSSERKLPKALDAGEPDFDSIMETSLSGLARELDRERYFELAVFPDGKQIPLATLALYWSTTEVDAQETVSAWLNLCLADNAQQFQLTLHALQLDYVKSVGRSRIKTLHTRLVDEYRKKCDSGKLFRGPSVAEEYFWNSIPYHLKEAGLEAELVHLLTDPAWLLQKVSRCGPPGLCRDLDYGNGDVYVALERTVRLVDSILSRDPSQLYFQLYSRLLDRSETATQELLAKISGAIKLRPVRKTLDSPGPLVRRLEGHSSVISSVAIDRNGTIAVSGSSDKTVIIWDIETGRIRKRLYGHRLEVSAVAISSDATKVVSGSADCTLIIWNAQTGEIERTLRGHTDRITAVAISADGSRAISASSDSTLIAWDLKAGISLHRFSGHTDEVTSVSLAVDRSIAVSGSVDATVIVWDIFKGEVLQRLKGHDDAVWSVAVTEDGGRAISSSHDKTLIFWDLGTGQILRRLTGHSEHVVSTAISGQFDRAISASADQTLILWDLTNGRNLSTLRGHSWDVKSVAMRDDAQLAVSASSDNSLIVWNLCSNATNLGSSPHKKWILATAFLSDTGEVISASDGELVISDFKTGAIRTRLDAAGITAMYAATSALGISGSHGGVLTLWNSAGRPLQQNWQAHQEAVFCVSISPDGLLAISGSLDKKLRLWSLNNFKQEVQLEGHSGSVRAVAITPGGDWAVSGSSDHTAILWDLKSGEIKQRMIGHSDWVKAISITADGSKIVTASSDGTLRVWNANGIQERRLDGHLGKVLSVVTTPDSRYAISGSWDRSIKIWRLHDGVCIGTFTFDAPISALSIQCRDQVYVAAGDARGVIHGLVVDL